MFTGIIEKVSSVLHVDSPTSGATQIRLSIETGFDDLTLGESISINGVCLTVAEFDGSQALFFVSHETLERTNLQQIRTGSMVNIERALMPHSRLSGHIVQGHIDSVTTLVSKESFDSGAWNLIFELPKSLSRYCVEKGSITLNGISLTVNQIISSSSDDFGDDQISVTIIPHTWNQTNFAYLEVGDPVNVELDVIAKYVERLCKPIQSR